MSFVISLLTIEQAQERISDLEYDLADYSMQLTRLSQESFNIVQEQQVAGQVYMANHLDEEGAVDISAIEYVNSAAFNSKFEARLRQIQAKEQKLQTQKMQVENQLNALKSEKESWDKNLDKGITTTFGYFK